MIDSGNRENSTGSLGHALSIAVFVTFGVCLSVDAIMCAQYVTPAAAPATLGFILLSATVLSGGVGLVLQAAIALHRHVPGVITRALAACVISWYPARWLATVITSGSGISRSGWAGVTWAVVLGALLLGAAITAGILPTVHGRLSRRPRVMIGAAIIALGLAALAITSFHATTYVRAYRGILVVFALLIEIGVVFAVGSRFQGPNRWRARLFAPAIFAAVFVLAFGLSRIGGSHRAYSSYTIFSHTLVAQKLLTVLLRISPVFEGTSRVNLDSTRLAPDNPVPVPPLSPGKYRGSNVLFITYDALRADYVSKTIDGRAVAPNLQALAAQGVSFKNAISNYSHTSRSLLSILAASWRLSFPSEEHVSTDPSDVRARTRLPRLLRGAGYETVAIMMSGRWGDVFFDKDRFPEFDRHIAAGEYCAAQVAAFQRYLTERTESRPFWAWVHIFDTHTPFDSSASAQLFGTSDAGQYAAAVHRGDRCLGELLASVKSREDWNNTIVVVSADHGEALGEHGRTLKHSTCYWHDIHIPLVIQLPDERQPRSIDYPIQPADLLPTIANLLGIRVDEVDVDGDDLSGLLDTGAVLPSRDTSSASMAFTQGHAKQYRCASVVAGRWHLIFTQAAQTYELYDRDADPREENNLAAERPDVLDGLQPVLDTFRQRAATAARP